MIIARLTGKYFGDERYATSFYSGSSVVRWDFYPPSVQFDTQIGDTPLEGDTVTGPFNVRLNSGIAVTDMGHSKPVSVDLYFTWLKDQAVDSTLRYKAENLKLSDLISNVRHVKYSYEFTTLTHRVSGIRWIDMLDPTSKPQWVTGWYAMTIVTQDELGNMGIAPPMGIARDNRNYNPRLIYIKTSK